MVSVRVLVIVRIVVMLEAKVRVVVTVVVEDSMRVVVSDRVENLVSVLEILIWLVRLWVEVEMIVDVKRRVDVRVRVDGIVMVLVVGRMEVMVLVVSTVDTHVDVVNLDEVTIRVTVTVHACSVDRINKYMGTINSQSALIFPSKEFPGGFHLWTIFYQSYEPNL